MSSLASELPSSGGRVALSLLSADDEVARYSVNLSDPTGRVEGNVTIRVSDGLVELNLESDAASWLVELARLLARGAWRNRQDKPWPRRITRWRGEPPRK